MKRIITGLLVCLFILSLVGCGGPKEIEGMEYTAMIGETQYKGTYSGTAVKNIPNGEGIFSAQNDFVTLSYAGTWESGVPVGTCSMILSDYTAEIAGKTYTGKYKGGAVDGKPEGEGEFNFSDERTRFSYSGQWEKGVPHGEGAFDWSQDDDYLRYSGQWAEGSFSGEGHLEDNHYVVHFQSGDKEGIFAGEVLDGIASGQGTFSAINSKGNEYTYEGSWLNGLWEGEGTWSFKALPYRYSGHYEKGEFLPTPAQFFASVGSEREYTPSSNAYAFLEKYPHIFENNSAEGEAIEFEEQFKYEAFAKNPSKYGDKLLNVNSLKVIQIEEYSDWDGKDVTWFVAEDSQHRVYYCYMFGYADNIYKDSRIKMVALPLDYMHYQNIYNNTVYAIACAVVSISQ